MFCRKCGKPVPGGQEYCDECRKLDIVTGEVSDDGSNSAMQGFVPALIAAIIAVTLMALVPVVAWLMSGGFSVPRILKIIIALTFAAGTTPAVILGIKSVRLFIRLAREKKKKPVVTLVLGIVALASSLSVITACLGFIKDIIVAMM